MPYLPRTVAAAALLATTCPLTAQSMSGEFTPNPPAPGQVVRFTMTNSSGAGLGLPSPCTWYNIHQGSQTGPILPRTSGCGSVIVPVAAGASVFFDWDQRDPSGSLVPPGDYWVETNAWDQNFSQLFTEWFCVSIRRPGEAALTSNTPLRVGQITTLTVQSPSDAGGAYFIALSFSANQPVTVAGLATCLSAPIVGDAFTAPFGFLDGAGQSTGITLTVPPIPALASLGIHAQALVWGLGGRKLTNGLPLTIRP